MNHIINANHIVTKFEFILSNNLKKYVRKMFGFKSWLYENDIVCFVLKGAETLPARECKTEENITLALFSQNSLPFAFSPPLIDILTGNFTFLNVCCF
jgi:hypothetical protein